MSITNLLKNGETMKTLFIVLFIFIVGITCSAQGLDGKWKGKVSTPNGDMNLTYTFKVDGETLTGTVGSDFSELALDNGKVDGNNFSFSININGQEMSSNGTLDGDVVKITAPMMQEPLVLNRVMEGSKIDGKWLGKISSPQGDMELTFTFKVDGDTLTGSSASQMGEMELTNGKVNGNEFSFDVDAGGMSISHKCKYLDDDSIEVKVNVMDNDMTMKLARVKE